MRRDARSVAPESPPTIEQHVEQLRERVTPEKLEEAMLTSAKRQRLLPVPAPLLRLWARGLSYELRRYGLLKGRWKEARKEAEDTINAIDQLLRFFDGDGREPEWHAARETNEWLELDLQLKFNAFARAAERHRRFRIDTLPKAASWHLPARAIASSFTSIARSAKGEEFPWGSRVTTQFVQKIFKLAGETYELNAIRNALRRTSEPPAVAWLPDPGRALLQRLVRRSRGEAA
jgi:hypothetical protein